MNLWELDAEEVLADGDIGLIPWIPQARSDEPIEEIIRRCAERLSAVPDVTERNALLSVTQILTILATPQRMKGLLLSQLL